MELRHLRYFVAVAEAGSLTVAARRRLHTAQPSLSRQLRDLEQEVGAALLVRGVRGVTLTPAGAAFLEHARLALAQAEAAVDAARRAARPARPSFALGFLTGQEVDWLSASMAILKDELAMTDVAVSSQYSPQLAEALVRGTLDLAFLRPEAGMPDLEYKLVTREELVVVLPADHRLAARATIRTADLAAETVIGMSETAPVLRAIIDAYLAREGVPIRERYAIDNLGMAMSLIASLRAVTLLPAYACNFLTRAVVSRKLAGPPPTIDLVIGYRRADSSVVLRRFLARVDETIARAAARDRPA